MNPRLDSLIRQREVIREHLRWLESEIETTRGVSSIKGSVGAPLATAAPSHPTAPQGATVEVWPRAPGPVAAPGKVPVDDVPDEVDVRGLHNEVRRGCMVYLALATAMLGLIIAFIYWRY